ncbi:hypothetical protein ACFL04_01935 [Patescibacteria group bacterium]
MKNKPKKETAKKAIPQTLKGHRNLALTFGLLTIFFVVIIVYFAFAKTTITLIPMPQPVTVIFPLTIQTTEEITEANDVISGQLLTVEAEASAEITDLKSEQTVEGKATGTVTIINNWTKSQPLAETTRLLTSDGILFRTNEFADVPAGGRVEVAVTADQAGATGDVGPTRFTIPGLWSGLHDQIYAESSQAMTGGELNQHVITNQDINNITNELIGQLKTNAQEDLESKLIEIDDRFILNNDMIFADILTSNLSASVEDIADQLSGTATANVIAVIINTTNLLGAIQEKLTLQLPPGEKIQDQDRDNYQIELESYDLDSQQATMVVQANGASTIDLNHDSFDPGRLTNMSRDEILLYLSDFNIIKSAEVDFSPFWVFRSPSLSDHIKIIINEQ